MTPREIQIKLAKKFYVKIRVMHEDLVYLQHIAEELNLKSKHQLPRINRELQKFHDEARLLERDLVESQKTDHEWGGPSGNMGLKEFVGI